MLQIPLSKCLFLALVKSWWLSAIWEGLEGGGVGGRNPNREGLITFGHLKFPLEAP